MPKVIALAFGGMCVAVAFAASATPDPNPAAPANNADAELTRELAAHILNGEGRGLACETKLSFTKDGFENARSSGALLQPPGRIVIEGEKFFGFEIAGPAKGKWVVPVSFGVATVASVHNTNLCIAGAAEILSIANAPLFGAGYKEVEFVEITSPPPELKVLTPYIRTRYRKKVTFQKTDIGWRVRWK